MKTSELKKEKQSEDYTKEQMGLVKEIELVKKLKNSFPDMLEFNNCLKELRIFWREQALSSQKQEFEKVINEKLKLSKSKWLKLSKEHCKIFKSPEGFVDKREHICGEKLSAIEGERMALYELKSRLNNLKEEKYNIDFCGDGR